MIHPRRIAAPAALAAGALAAALLWALPASAALAPVKVGFGEYFYKPAVVTVKIP